MVWISTWCRTQETEFSYTCSKGSIRTETREQLKMEFKVWWNKPRCCHQKPNSTKRMMKIRVSRWIVFWGRVFTVRKRLRDKKWTRVSFLKNSLAPSSYIRRTKEIKWCDRSPKAFSSVQKWFLWAATKLDGRKRRSEGNRRPEPRISRLRKWVRRGHRASKVMPTTQRWSVTVHAESATVIRSKRRSRDRKQRASSEKQHMVSNFSEATLWQSKTKPEPANSTSWKTHCSKPT